MIKKAYSVQATSVLPSTATSPKKDPRLHLLPPPPSSGEVRYRVRVGNKLFEGTDTRHLLRLAVRARRSQVRATEPLER